MNHVTKRDLPVQETQTLIASFAKMGTISKVQNLPHERIHVLPVTWRKIVYVFAVMKREKIVLTLETKDVLYVKLNILDNRKCPHGARHLALMVTIQILKPEHEIIVTIHEPHDTGRGLITV